MSKITISAAPAKKFFVDMLTRDIELIDAILDLIDNSLDGAMRETIDKASDEKKYKGYYAKLTMDDKKFIIEDNCGGIPLDLAYDQAFRLGNTKFGQVRDMPTIGVYGIGMKRAIFKLGKSSLVSTKTIKDEYRVEVSPEWLLDDNNWELPFKSVKTNLDDTGTIIEVDQLRESISQLLGDEKVFQSNLINVISHHFAIVINKGFKITLNGKTIHPSLTSLMMNDKSFKESTGLAPYVYVNDIKGVKIELAVGFYRELTTEEEDEQYLESKNSSEKAGWTIICNDRVVVYADKTRLTGWGEAGVPGYHPQFIGIAGVLKFTSNDASLLPVTTTKRGVDGNSDLYLAVKDYMRDGLKVFTSFTNKWKSFGNSNNTIVSMSNKTISASSNEIINTIPKNKFKANPKPFGGEIYKPSLPVPKIENKVKTIKYSVDVNSFNQVAEYLFDNVNISAADLGKGTFELALKEAQENE
ncbi:ATP-binding protein [Pseudescherichia sp.]|uniref:ATP-binding protein n=1 Tax=Pseudescherichia sp. TaxID=2055881 RepID=UPI0028AB4246|nr:ATP-binding protein [Pseudescherichia sp.]